MGFTTQNLLWFLSREAAGKIDTLYTNTQLCLTVTNAGLGAEISEKSSEKGLEDDLHKIIGVCDVCFKDATDQEVYLTSLMYRKSPFADNFKLFIWGEGSLALLSALAHGWYRCRNHLWRLSCN